MAKNHPLRVFCSTLKSDYILLTGLFVLAVAQFVHQDDAGFGSGKSRLSPDNIAGRRSTGRADTSPPVHFQEHELPLSFPAHPDGADR